MNEIEMKKMSKYQLSLYLISNELMEIKNHLSNGRSFEGGYNLGNLYNSISNQMEKNIEDGLDEEEDEEDGMDYQNMYLEENRERKRVIQYNKNLYEHKEILVNLIKSLVSDDKIFPNEVESVIKILSTVLPGTNEKDLFESLRPNALKLG